MLALALLLQAGSAQAGGYAIVYAFPEPSNGAYSNSGVMVDGQGNLYETTSGGGKANIRACRCGTVFTLTPKGVETILHVFNNKARGDGPGGLIEDGSGNLYGTTAYGGKSHNDGTVYKLSPNGKYTVLRSFRGGNDGAAPFSTLIADSAGNLYGTTSYGGGTGCNGYGCGTVFKLASSGTETALHAFSGGSDGDAPDGALVADGAGNLYGTTYSGGGGIGCYENGGGCGTVFEITP